MVISVKPNPTTVEVMLLGELSLLQHQIQTFPIFSMYNPSVLLLSMTVYGFDDISSHIYVSQFTGGSIYTTH